jgi:hypothetical protein
MALLAWAKRDFGVSNESPGKGMGLPIGICMALLFSDCKGSGKANEKK